MLTVLPRNPGSSGLSACLLVRGSRCLVGSTLPEPNKQVEMAKMTMFVSFLRTVRPTLSIGM